MFSNRCQQIGCSTLKIKRPVSFLGLLLPFNHQSTRLITSTNVNLQNHYESLGVPRTSTQNEIKAAYYKLSMIYHPDKNQGSEEAAKKFREITRAYEILSNYRLRRLYDKGIIHTAGEEYAQTEDIRREDIVEDDPQTKFYKSRFHKSKVTTSEGERPIYNFDEWAKAHYGKSFDRKKTAKERYDRKTAQNQSSEISAKNELAIFGVVLSVVLFYLVAFTERSYDTPKRNGRTKQDVSETK